MTPKKYSPNEAEYAMAIEKLHQTVNAIKDLREYERKLRVKLNNLLDERMKHENRRQHPGTS